MKKFIKKLAAFTACLTAAAALTACGGGSGEIQIGVPNDTTNEARALLLLQELGYLTLTEDAGITATVSDIAENPYNITFKEVEAAQLPNVLQDMDYAVINSNYAIDAGLNPMEDALALEGSFSAYSNVLVVKEGNENNDNIKALKAALESQQVADFITEEYGGAVVSTVENPTDGFDASVDYDALAGTTITVAASPAPHAEILQVAKEILAEREITLDIMEFTDYIQPNNVVESGEVDANYFQHQPYLDEFNASNNTSIVSVGTVHYEPFGIYAGKTTSLEDLPDGATIAVPNDATNEARALLLLEANGLITLSEDAGLTATVLDIEENPHNYKITELEAAQVSISLPDVDIGVINGNFAIQAGLKASDALAIEDKDSLAATTYANVLCVKEGNEQNQATLDLLESLHSDTVRTFIEDTYEGAVVPSF